MKRAIAILLVLAFLSPSMAQAADFAMPDLLHGQQFAGFLGAVTEKEMDQALDDAISDALAVQKQEMDRELEEKTIIERDKTNDTIAAVAFGLFFIMALTHQSRNGDNGTDGVDGKDGTDGKDGADGRPRPCVTF